MRTTVDLDDDTFQAVDDLRKRGRGVSEAVNELIRRGLLSQEPSRAFEPRTRRLGLRIDVSNVADAIEVLEGPETR